MKRQIDWWGHPTYWVYQVLGWGGWWLFETQAVDTERVTDPSAAWFRLGAEFLALLLSHVYRGGIHYCHWRELTWAKLLPRVVGACLLLGVLHTGVIWPIIAPLLQENMPTLSPGLVYFWTSVGTALLFLGWSAIYFGYQHQRALTDLQLRQTQLESAAHEAALAALRMQVNPHFLFNSLNTLRALIDENPARASEAVTQLAKVFRASLTTSRTRLIPLSEELETVEAYLDLEKLRLEERLRIEARIDPATLPHSVPPFLLQTLVENAVKYGIAPSQEGGVIHYESKLVGTQLVLRVTNPGQLATGSSSTGIGLKNARERLQLLFGSEATLEVVNLDGPRVEATVRLPVNSL